MERKPFLDEELLAKLDLKAEGIIVGHGNQDMPRGCCAIFVDGEMLYAGPIEHSIVVPGVEVVLNPVDLGYIDEFMRKRLH